MEHCGDEQQGKILCFGCWNLEVSTTQRQFQQIGRHRATFSASLSFTLVSSTKELGAHQASHKLLLTSLDAAPQV